MYDAIVVGTDGSDAAGAAVARAVALAAAVGARLDVVGVGEAGDLDTVLRSAADDADAAGVTEVAVHARQGDPADAILDVAEETGADLVVVGHKGMTGARRFLLGSVPTKITAHAPCSVLVVRTS